MPGKNTLTQGDFAQITNIFRSELQPVKDEVEKHKLILFGPQGETGLVAQVEAHESLKKKAGPLVAVASLLASAAGYWVPKIFGQK